MGPARIVALAATGLVAFGLARLVRRRPATAPAVRAGLGIVLLGGAAAHLAGETLWGRLTWGDFAPLELCDLAIFVAAFALGTENRLAAEAVWFWGLSGTVLAMVTPDLPHPFPDARWFAYYGMHGAVVVSAAVLTMGLGLRPRPGAPWRVFRVTLAYAGIVAIVDLTTGANFLYLRHKPAEPTLLDSFGPWPVYLLVTALVAIVLFHLLMLPFLSPGRTEALDRGRSVS